MITPPCKGCTERHTACQDACSRPEWLEYRAKLEAAKGASRRYNECRDVSVESMLRYKKRLR